MVVVLALVVVLVLVLVLALVLALVLVLVVGTAEKAWWWIKNHHTGYRHLDGKAVLVPLVMVIVVVTIVVSWLGKGED